MFTKKRIGELLQEAHIINECQLSIALKEQSVYPQLKLGDILFLNGWLTKETANFFANDIKQINKQKKILIGNIFLKAGLLSEDEIQDILREQKQLGLRFGEIIILKGLIKKETVTFFIENFALYKNKKDFYEYKRKQQRIQLRLNKFNKLNRINQSLNQFNIHRKRALFNQAKSNKVKMIDFNDIDWRG